MASNGIRDRVAIVGMGCTTFGEHWGRSIDDLLIDAVQECVGSVDGFDQDRVDAYWLGTMGSGTSGMTLSRPLKVDRPVTRVENYCATGSEAVRNAAYAVASGAYDCVMAVGGEKLKDSGFSGLVVPPASNDGTASEPSAPAMFSLLAPAYCARYGVSEQELKEVLTRIAWKNHRNGALNERAQFRSEVPIEKIAASPIVAGQLGIFDCSGVADGAAAALIVRAEDAHRYSERPMYIKGLSFVAGAAQGPVDPDYDFTSFGEVVLSAQDAYRQAGIDDPRRQLSLAEVHDCFTPTELVLMEDLGFSERGAGWRDVQAGVFDLDGELPVNPDGGLKSFGHPIGASGLRMLFECWQQFRGEAGERQLERPELGLTHNLGGSPGACVSFVSIVGAERDV
ncbi:acetyl-CoA acetyltransferase [Patulibacter defluvii]|uniref:acetyl-CoA acetyltransferase n=1 Tax=Patulibacter defluvii TaxID=3095358 RepID=UPI002A75004D|nr:acetyl-CoA acetyltransferase [Patulibacter sp. DM4]